MPRARRRRPRQPIRPEAVLPEPVLIKAPPRASRVTPAREWRWRTFPVYFTFSVTFFSTTIVAALLARTSFFGVFLLVGAAFLSFALAHLVLVGIIGAGRLKRSQNR